MDRTSLLTLFILTTICQNGAGSMFDWFWGKSEEATVLVADGVPLISIPYEAMTEDEKFLQEAAKFTDIQVSSPLETCQHKVIMKIRTSCSDMTEEQLAKLSVNLLNCQSAVEGRKMFPCTEEMSLKQCTTDMDADMWNAYHLMSNRARAVCYAARSTQFRALTDLTVNKLMQTAHTQIKTMSSLKESQDRLEEQTVEALASLSTGNQALLQQQKHLQNAQETAHNLVTTNLRELSTEKAMIRAGHAQLAMMTEDIKKKLEVASQNLEEQAIVRGENHKELLEDLMKIQDQAQEIWDKIESSTSRIFQQHEQAIDQYEQTLQKLAQVNENIQFIWNLTNTMRVEVDRKLNWITNYIGDTGEQMQSMYHTGLHIVYLLVAMIVSAFLQAPLLTRITIMGLVPLNLASYLKHGIEASLDFTSMTTLIFLITAMHFLMVGIQRLFGPKTTKTRAGPVQYADRNGHANETASEVSSSSRNLQKNPSLSLYTKLTRTARRLYDVIGYQTSRCIRTCVSLVQSATTWTRMSMAQREELSCSYMPLKKSREDVVYNYEREYPSMSEDVTDFESSTMQNDKLVDSSSDFYENVLDANDLRRRMKMLNGYVDRRSYSHEGSQSRSVTPSYPMPRMLCNGVTRSGRKCRLISTQGRNFCSKHITGTSVAGD